MNTESRILPTVLIACPVSSRGWILPYYLNHIVNLDYPKQLISLYFIINNSTDNSKDILYDFKHKYSSFYDSITIERYKSDHKPKDLRHKNIRTEYTYHHLSILRNKILNYTYENNFDYCFSVDSDILVPTNILRKLLAHQKDIVSGIIYNGFLVNPSEPWKYPNVMRLNNNGIYEHIANSYVKSSPRLVDSKLIQVNATGAIVLISNKICRNAKYGFHEQGEDLYWSLDCMNKGHKIYADYSAYAFHAMNQDLLQDYIKTN